MILLKCQSFSSFYYYVWNDKAGNFCGIESSFFNCYTFDKRFLFLAIDLPVLKDQALEKNNECLEVLREIFVFSIQFQILLRTLPILSFCFISNSRVKLGHLETKYQT